MNLTTTEYQYQVDEKTFLKRWDELAHQFTFYENGQPVTLTRWNQVVNQVHPMIHKAEHSNPLVRWIEQQRCRITSRLGNPTAARVLDIGCESGHVTGQSVQQAQLGVLADMDTQMLLNTRNRVAPQIRLLGASITELPFQDNSFDLIYCTEVLEHLSHPGKAVQELARILAPKGKLVVSVPNDRLIIRVKQALKALHLTALLGPLSLDLAMGHIQLFTRNSLQELISPHLKIQRLFFSQPFRLNLFSVATKEEL